MTNAKWIKDRDAFAEKQERNRSRNPMMGGSTKLDVTIGADFGRQYEAKKVEELIAALNRIANVACAFDAPREFSYGDWELRQIAREALGNYANSSDKADKGDVG